MEKNLFIIGNGFDIAHGIKTKYIHFHDYLKENYYDGELDSYSAPEWYMLPKGDVVYDSEDVVKFLRTVISNAERNNENWEAVETSLGKLDFSTFLDNYFIDKDAEDFNEWEEVNRIQSIASVC